MQGTQDYPPCVIPSGHTQLDFVRIKHIGLALQCYAWRSRRHSGGVAELVVENEPSRSDHNVKTTSRSGDCAAGAEGDGQTVW
jgi:hypothetical protein